MFEANPVAWGVHCANEEARRNHWLAQKAEARVKAKFYESIKSEEPWSFGSEAKRAAISLPAKLAAKIKGLFN